MFSAMLFIFFCFFGILAMFFHVLWRQEQIAKSLKEENTQLRVLLRALESRMDYLAQICLAEKGQLPDSSIRDTRARADMAGIDPLLHLSFDEPGHPVEGNDKTGMDIHLP
ncbi:MAG: hypothetical protein OSJ28_02075 [Desulfovibrio sp.]|jgi:hypothetical protein|nr:hypothetical protein [Desulfovibrio sp.]